MASLIDDEPYTARSWRRALNSDAAPVRGSRRMRGSPSGRRTLAPQGGEPPASSRVSYSHLVVVVVPLQSLVLGVVGMVGRLVVLVARVLGSCRLLFAVGRLVACRASQAVALVPSTCLVVVVLVLLPLPLVLHSLLAPCPSCLVTTRRSRALN